MTQINQKKETKDKITPTAFIPDESLFNLPLARPWKRGGAMLCDLMVIGMLTALGDALLVGLLLLCWVIYKAKGWSSIKLFGAYTVWIIRGGSCLIILLSLWINSYSLADTNQYNNQSKDIIKNGVTLGDSIYEGQKCTTAKCWKPHLTALIEASIGFSDSMKTSEITTIVSDVIDESRLSQEEQLALREWVLSQPQWKQEQLDKGNESNFDHNYEKSTSYANKKTSENNKAVSSPMQWLYGIIEDLGLGFGFAAIYFTCFTAWFNGQTLGKMFFNIRVIQLNNTPIGLWDSFGRYGGYGAGLATGLLGFIQVYWDENRQAIQDKISATVVIDLTLSTKEEKILIDNALSETLPIILGAQNNAPESTSQTRLERE